MYARGMTMREIQGFLAERYAVDVSTDLISSVTDAVMAEVTAWQPRPLESMHPVVFFDALRLECIFWGNVKIREDAVVRSKAAYAGAGCHSHASAAPCQPRSRAACNSRAMRGLP